ncbi:MAG: chemotaxis protein CheW [Clostridium sp.]|uniref:chemotaxis protein CheW n=1 Tax=Clostridium sp. TaxID=1506 RepID=UPI003F2DDB35
MQIVVFKLGEEHFAVKTEKVQGINDIMSITKVPNAPSHIKGLINLRGSIKSLVDINLLLNISNSSIQENIIILDIDGEEIGILVDTVEEVLSLNDDELRVFSGENKEDYIEGIIKYEDRLLTVIDIEKLLN